MSQRIHKKDLSIMDSVVSLSDQELRAALKAFDISPGPITDSTRNLYRKKLATLMEEKDKGRVINSEATMSDDDDTSDEDFEVRDEDLDDEEEEDEESEEEDELAEEEEEDLLSELQDDDLTSSRIHADRTSMTYSFANSASRAFLIATLTFLVPIAGFYLISTNKLELLEPLKPFKDITKRILILLTFSPMVYALYKIFTFFRLRSHEDGKKVCNLVSEALELLQSPENPKGLMPVLHIRDTLLTPAERKAKKANLLWQKAVNFIEEHESRVKVEMVNIDGEDFRAWKWIGSRKL